MAGFELKAMALVQIEREDCYKDKTTRAMMGGRRTP